MKKIYKYLTVLILAAAVIPMFTGCDDFLNLLLGKTGDLIVIDQSDDHSYSNTTVDICIDQYTVSTNNYGETVYTLRKEGFFKKSLKPGQSCYIGDDIPSTGITSNRCYGVRAKLSGDSEYTDLKNIGSPYGDNDYLTIPFGGYDLIIYVKNLGEMEYEWIYSYNE